MQFLKILFGCLVAFVAAVFTIGNWTTVPVQLPGGLVAETNLPLLLLLAFLAGLLPMLLYGQIQRWRLRQRIAVVERQLSELHALTPAPSPSPDAGHLAAATPAIDRKSVAAPGEWS